MSTYEKCLFLITTGTFIKDDMQEKIDTFYLCGRLTSKDYQHLNSMLNPKTEE